MVELKPCPFCGGEVHLHKFRWQHGCMFGDPYYQVICTNCRIAIGDYDTKGEATEVWNNRTAPTCTKGEATEVWNNRTAPTCTMNADYFFRQEELYPCNGMRCSNCGELVWDVNTLHYCPNCGHKVVEE